MKKMIIPVFIILATNLYAQKDIDALINAEKSWDSFPVKVDYTILGSGIADSKDLGYVYGKLVVNGKTDNYLRIWRRESNAWKIVLEVLRY